MHPTAYMLPVALLAACSGVHNDSPDAPKNARPTGSPDIVLFAVSGHTLTGNTNEPYLQETGQRLAMTLRRQLGASVELRLYGDELYSWGQDAGFIELTNDMLEVALAWQLDPASEWKQEFDNPTRSVVLGHSHGVVWAHHAVETTPELLVDLLVDYDAVSLYWQEESLTGIGDNWFSEIEVYYDANGGNPWLHDVRFLSWKTSGGAADIKDIAPDNVLANVEFWADPSLGESILGVYDTELNVRWDGTKDGVFGVQTSESHRSIDDPDSEATEVLEELLLKFYATEGVL